ncbi:MAG: response regulator transcription factor [Bacteroidetes bacterium]|nr:response regulator transcription factor [Bacteroidota bacterium]
MEKLKCLIVDDERLAQELLERYIQKIPSLEMVASCSTALEAMQYLSQKKIDILFLDIQMPDLTGIEFLRSIKNQPATIFTTAYSEYALEGYELSIVDYLLKPIEFERFFQAVGKAMNSLQKNLPNSMVDSRPNKAIEEDYFFIKTDNKIVRVAFDDVLFIEALQKYIRIYTIDKKVVSLLSLSKMEAVMPAHQFIRIHRSYIINIDKVDNVERNMVNIKEHQLSISKGQREVFMRMLRKKGLFN